jgi:hypothetical protein
VAKITDRYLCKHPGFIPPATERLRVTCLNMPCGERQGAARPPGARTKTQFNGVGRLRTYISFTHSAF